MSLSAKEEYERLLRKLHKLIHEGKSDSDEAEKIRDEMDEPWKKMTDNEEEEIACLSEELYKEAGK